MAIVPYKASEKASTQYLGLVCTEMPEARFEDIVTVSGVERYPALVDIDSKLISVCEKDSIVVIGVAANKPIPVGAHASRSQLTIEVWSDDIPEDFVIHVRLSGKRKDMPGRFVEHSKEQMERNNKFWWNAVHG